MLAERELVALLYRADWTRLGLSGEVSGVDETSLTMITHVQAGHRETGGSFPPFPPEFTARRPELTRLLVAPGRRYRKDRQDGQVTQGCDGERIWLWWRDPPPGEVHLRGGPEPPFPALLCPSWLLAGYDLEVGKAVSACGRVPPGRPVVDEPSGRDRPPSAVNLITSVAKAAADAIKRRADGKVAGEGP
jgi:hypothetical protein